MSINIKSAKGRSVSGGNVVTHPFMNRPETGHSRFRQVRRANYNIRVKPQTT